MTREMFCLMEGRHVHPSTLYPGGVGTVPTVQLFTDYLVRLMKYVEFMKKVVPLHDDLFDFFYEALPGYEEVGQPPRPAGLLGLVQRPRRLRLHLQEHERVGQGDVRHARRRRRRQARHHTTWWTSTSASASCWAARTTTTGRTARCSSRHDPLGNPVDRRHPWNQTTMPRPQKRDFEGKYTWVMSPRWYDKRTGITWPSTPAAGRSPGSGRRRWPGWSTSATSRRPASSVKIYLPKTATHAARSSSSGRSPSGATPSSATGPGPISRPTRRRAALYFVEQALKELHAGRTKTWTEFKVPDEAIGCGFHEAVRGVLSHHVVIRDGKIANYHPYPPTPWNANPRDIYGTPGPYEDAVQNTPIFEENGPDKFKGIDIMRTVRSFDPCLPCGVHMYLGDGKVLERAACAHVRCQALQLTTVRRTVLP